MAFVVLLTVLIVHSTFAYDDDVYRYEPDAVYPYEEIKRSSDANFLRFGRGGELDGRTDVDDSRPRYRRPQSNNDYFIRFGRTPDFLRFGRADPDDCDKRSKSNANFLRFGRNAAVDAEEVARKKRNADFLRFGRDHTKNTHEERARIQQFSPFIEILNELAENLKTSSKSKNVV